MGLKNKLTGIKPNERHAKVNLDVLKRMHYSDFNLGDDDDFKPSDIIDEDDDSEDSILEQYNHKYEENVPLPNDKFLVINSNTHNYDEKIVNIKQQIKSTKNPTARYNDQDSQNFGNHNKSVNPINEKSMLSRYRGGRNVSQINSKNNIQNSYIAYPPLGAKMRNNNSVSKISQSVDMNPAKQGHHSIVTPSKSRRLNPQNTTKASNSKKPLLSSKPRRASIVLPVPHKSQHPLSNINAPKARTKRNLSKIGDTRTERGILKMVDQQINKGMRAANKQYNL